MLEKLNKKSRLFEDCWHSSSVKFRPFLFLNSLAGFSIFDPKECGERKGGGAVNQALVPRDLLARTSLTSSARLRG